MSLKELQFWVAVGLVSIISIALFKILAAQPWAPEGLREFAGSL